MDTVDTDTYTEGRQPRDTKGYDPRTMETRTEGEYSQRLREHKATSRWQRQASVLLSSSWGSIAPHTPFLKTSRLQDRGRNTLPGL